MTVTVDELVVADPADAWTAAGFSVDPDAVCRVGGVRIRQIFFRFGDVQPGRRITTLCHHELGMSVRSAMISARR
jgi:hypothetical protein